MQTAPTQVIGGGAVVSQLVCMDDAAALAKAFLDGAPLPTVQAVASAQIRERAVLRAPDNITCPLVQVIRPLASTNGGIEVRYARDELAARLPPLATCDEAEDGARAAPSKAASSGSADAKPAQ